MSGRGRMTCYYSQPIKAGSDFDIRWTDKDGVERVFQAEEHSLILAEIEASAHIFDDSGRRRSLAKIGGTVWDRSQGKKYQKILRPGSWKETLDAPYGIGNHGNPLAPWVHCAADQSVNPYGSRVTIDALKGLELKKLGVTLSGVMWVSDTGDAIKGPNRLDWMVGDYENFQKLPDDLQESTQAVQIDPLPEVPDKLNPLTAVGLQGALKKLGFDLGSWGPNNDGIDGKIGATTLQALSRFQGVQPAIPTQEYGRWPIGPVTLWFLVDALRARTD